LGGHGGRDGKNGSGPLSFGGVQNLTNNVSVNQGQKLEEVLRKWLRIPQDFTDRHHELQKLHHKDTGSWLLRDDQFLGWKAEPGYLWITRKSGTGKSVLRSFILQL
ncbi:hypothetical protein R3P38DRAFT_2357045, partial [Favolaschia claudopus]